MNPLLEQNIFDGSLFALYDFPIAVPCYKLLKNCKCRRRKTFKKSSTGKDLIDVFLKTNVYAYV